jgi:hypothetical protein
VLGEFLATLEIEFLLAAFLSGTSGGITVRPGIAKDGSTKLFVNQDSGLPFRHAGLERSLESVVDYLLGGGDLCRLIWA